MQMLDVIFSVPFLAVVIDPVRGMHVQRTIEISNVPDR